MKLAFTLTMPGVGSWNGRWSGGGKRYVAVKSFSNSRKGREIAEKVLANAPYSYQWEDGWMARIDVCEVEPRKGAQLTKASSGFCGYEWMIDSILSHGAIYASHQTPEAITA